MHGDFRPDLKQDQDYTDIIVPFYQNCKINRI
jgi:hypothetical protein